MPPLTSDLFDNVSIQNYYIYGNISYKLDKTVTGFAKRSLVHAHNYFELKDIMYKAVIFGRGTHLSFHLYARKFQLKSLLIPKVISLKIC